jgi:ABC-2 type transport system permease protein
MSEDVLSAAPLGCRSARPPRAVRQVLVVARHTAILAVRDPTTVFAYTVMAMVLLTVLRPVYERLGTFGGPAIDQQAPGTAVMFTLLALDIAGQSLLSERTWRTWDRLRAGSVGPLTAMVGKAVPLSAVFVLQQTALFVFADAAYGFDIAAGSWRLPFVVVVWSVCVSGIGLAVGAWVRTQGQLSAAADVGALAVTCLSGSLVPLAILPPCGGCNARSTATRRCSRRPSPCSPVSASLPSRWRPRERGEGHGRPKPPDAAGG